MSGEMKLNFYHGGRDYFAETKHLQPLTGEGCGYSLRILHDLTNEGRYLLQEIMGVRSLNLPRAWNGQAGAEFAAQLAYPWPDELAIFHALDRGYGVVRVEATTRLGQSGFYVTASRLTRDAVERFAYYAADHFASRDVLARYRLTFYADSNEYRHQELVPLTKAMSQENADSITHFLAANGVGGPYGRNTFLPRRVLPYLEAIQYLRFGAAGVAIHNSLHRAVALNEPDLQAIWEGDATWSRWVVKKNPDNPAGLHRHAFSGRLK